MENHSQRRLDIYSEVCPASSATIIGAGLVTSTMGSLPMGVMLVAAGIVVGIAGPITKTLQERKSPAKRRWDNQT